MCTIQPAMLIFFEMGYLSLISKSFENEMMAVWGTGINRPAASNRIPIQQTWVDSKNKSDGLNRAARLFYRMVGRPNTIGFNQPTI